MKKAKQRDVNETDENEFIAIRSTELARAGSERSVAEPIPITSNWIESIKFTTREMRSWEYLCKGAILLGVAHWAFCAEHADMLSEEHHFHGYSIGIGKFFGFYGRHARLVFYKNPTNSKHWAVARNFNINSTNHRVGVSFERSLQRTIILMKTYPQSNKSIMLKCVWWD